MNIRELHEMLSHGELQNLALSNNGNGTIREADYAKIRNYANDALVRLYSQFVLKEKDILVQTYSWITNYHLVPKFAVNYTPAGTTDDEPTRYILDLPGEPFTGDIIKVLAVYDECRNQLPLNDAESLWSVFTPMVNVLQVPTAQFAGVISVQYQAKHPKLGDDLDQEIELPEVLWPALTAFIAYKAHSYMNQQDSTVKAQEHLAMYEAVCKAAKQDDLVNSSIVTTNTKFKKWGWV